MKISERGRRVLQTIDKLENLLNTVLIFKKSHLGIAWISVLVTFLFERRVIQMPL